MAVNNPGKQVMPTPLGRSLASNYLHPLLLLLQKVLPLLRAGNFQKHWLKLLVSSASFLLLRWSWKRRAVTAPAVTSTAAKHSHRDEVLPSTMELLTSVGLHRELGLVAVLSVLASMTMIRKAKLLGESMARQHDAATLWTWLSPVLQYPLFCVMNVIFVVAGTQVASRLELSWRNSVTQKLHDLYFSKMRYYRILNESHDATISDPDIRICSDVRTFVESAAVIAVNLTKALAFTLIFGSVTWRNRDWAWSLACPGVFVVATAWIFNSESPQSLSIRHGLEEAQGRYAQLLLRLQSHADRISMLQGEGYELNVLEKLVVDIGRLRSERIRALFYRNLAQACSFGSAGGTNYLELFGHMASSFRMGSIASHCASGSQLPVDSSEPFAWSTDVLSAGLQDLHGFYNAATGWWSVTAALVTWNTSFHMAQRVKQLYTRLMELEAKLCGGPSVFRDLGPRIIFEKVTIQTPRNEILLTDLSFQVEEGEMLLICGHNGAGKSSIIRSLCNLWPCAAGVIARPGGSLQAEEQPRLHEEIYYLPQRPMNVIGTLSDQLTYPCRPQPSGLEEEEIRRYLRYVDLEYLADRHLLSDASRFQVLDWEAILSASEQQALGIARLLYHQPRFAILDECTSSLGRSLETRLFRLIPALGIACITITHRPALEQHHSRLLQLTGRGEDGRGWRMIKLMGSGTERPRRMDRSMAQRIIEEHLAGEMGQLRNRGAEERRDADIPRNVGPTAAEAVCSLLPSRWRRLWAFVRVGLQTPAQRRSAGRRTVIMLALLRMRVAVFWISWRTTIQMWKSGMTGASGRTILLHFFAAAASVWVSGFLDESVRFQAVEMGNEIGLAVVKRLQSEMLTGRLLRATRAQSGSRWHGIDPMVGPVENPVLRLAEVMSLFDALASEVTELLLPLAQALWIFPTMFRGVAWLSPLLLLVNFLLYRGTQLLAPNLPTLQAQAMALEARFQQLHTRLRRMAEPVAFSGGGSTERAIIEPHFQAILRHKEGSLRAEFLYNLVLTFFTDYRQMPIWTQRLVSAQFSMRHNPPHSASGVSADVLCAGYLFDRSIFVSQTAIQKLVRFDDAMSRIDGQCIRCLELIGSIRHGVFHTWNEQTEEGTIEQVNFKEPIEVDGLDLVTPLGICLAKGLAFKVEPDVPMLVSGPVATGKSLLASYLLGHRPGGLRPDDQDTQRPSLLRIMPATQQIYLPTGSLLDQVIYPTVVGNLWAPYTCLATELPLDTTEAELLEHFHACGAASCHLFPGETGALGARIRFSTREGLAASLARPQDRHLKGVSFHMDFDPDGTAAPGVSLLRARSCLVDAGLEHVLLREPKGWSACETWDHTLSGGEQQRLCLARLFYQRPTFALLDDCTSMVALDSEEELYRRIHLRGITAVTLTQRSFLPDLYQCELSLGVQSSSRWELRRPEAAT